MQPRSSFQGRRSCIGSGFEVGFLTVDLIRLVSGIRVSLGMESE